MAQTIHQLLASRLIECKDGTTDLTFPAPEWFPASLTGDPLQVMLDGLVAAGQSLESARAGLAYHALANIRTELRSIRRPTVGKDGNVTQTDEKRLALIADFRPEAPTQADTASKLLKAIDSIDPATLTPELIAALRTKLSL
jgi:hypothetical protein